MQSSVIFDDHFIRNGLNSVTPPLLHALALRFPGATWLSVEPARIRKERWYHILWEDRLGLGQLIVSEREFRWMLAGGEARQARKSSGLYQQVPTKGECVG